MTAAVVPKSRSLPVNGRNRNRKTTGSGSAASTLGEKGDWRLNQIDRQQLIIPYAAAPLIDAKTYPFVTKSDAALLKILRIYWP